MFRFIIMHDSSADRRVIIWSGTEILRHLTFMKSETQLVKYYWPTLHISQIY